MTAPGPPHPGFGPPPVPWVTAAGWSAPKGYTPDGRRLAGIGSRFVALLVDSLLWAVPMVALMAVVLVALVVAGPSWEGESDPPPAFFGLLALLYLGIFAVGVARFVYQAEAVHRRGQTVGQRLAKVRVVDARTGGPLSRGRSYGRALGTILSASLYNLGYVWAFWEPRRRTFHDMLADTVVVEA